MRMRRRVGVRAASAIAALLLADCTGGNSAESSSTPVHQTPPSSRPSAAAASVSRTGAVAVGSDQKVNISATHLTRGERTGLTGIVASHLPLYVGSRLS